MKWLRKMLGLCVHHWEIVDRVVITNDGIAVGDRFISHCRNCGKIKKTDIK